MVSSHMARTAFVSEFFEANFFKICLFMKRASIARAVRSIVQRILFASDVVALSVTLFFALSFLFLDATDAVELAATLEVTSIVELDLDLAVWGLDTVVLDVGGLGLVLVLALVVAALDTHGVEMLSSLSVAVVMEGTTDLRVVCLARLGGGSDASNCAAVSDSSLSELISEKCSSYWV